MLSLTPHKYFNQNLELMPVDRDTGASKEQHANRTSRPIAPIAQAFELKASAMPTDHMLEILLKEASDRNPSSAHLTVCYEYLSRPKSVSQ